MDAPNQRASAAAEDWQAHLEREEARYLFGERRLPDAADADARQRQLTRLGNASAGAGLALLMLGRRDEAAAALTRAAERYRESFPDAPPDSWGRPIGAAKARVLAEDWDGAAADVGDALAFVAAHDVVGYAIAVDSVLESFESRDEYLEDIPVADTVLVLQALAARRGIAAELSSPLLVS